MSRENDAIIRRALRELNDAVEFLERIEHLDKHHAREVIENCRRAADHMLKAVDIVEAAYVGSESLISETADEEDSD
jgi:DNA-directed RNA polymerase subunit F